MEENTSVKEQSKKPNKFVRVLKKIFVEDAAWKLLSIVFAAALWVLSVGLM